MNTPKRFDKIEKLLRGMGFITQAKTSSRLSMENSSSKLCVNIIPRPPLQDSYEIEVAKISDTEKIEGSFIRVINGRILDEITFGRGETEGRFAKKLARHLRGAVFK